MVSGYIHDNDPAHPGWGTFHAPSIDGGSVDIPAASFTSCGFNNSVTAPGLPWTLNVHPIDGTVNSAHISGIDVTVVGSSAPRRAATPARSARRIGKRRTT